MNIRRLQEDLKEKGYFFGADHESNFLITSVTDKEKSERTFSFFYDSIADDINVDINVEVPTGTERAGFVVDKDTFLSLSEEMFDNFVEVAIANIAVKKDMRLNTATFSF